MPEPTERAELLTEAEFEALALTQKLYSKLIEIIGAGEDPNPTSRPEATALVRTHIGTLQRIVMSQAAARAYPDRIQLLGHSTTIKDQPT